MFGMTLPLIFLFASGCVNIGIDASVPPILDGGAELGSNNDLAVTIGMHLGDDLDECKAEAVRKLDGVSCRMAESSKEYLGKLAVRLLNCQRKLEERSQFECTTDMHLKDCTGAMDETVWGSYMQMQRSTHAICLHFQQAQWRTETTETVRELVTHAESARSTLGELFAGQGELQKISRETQEELESNHKKQLEVQQELGEKTLGVLGNVNELQQLHSSLVSDNTKLIETVTATQSRFDTFHSNIEERMSDYKDRLQSVYAVVETVLKLEQSLAQQFFDTYSLLYYLTATVILYLFSTPPETRQSRLLLFFYMLCNLVIERTMFQQRLQIADINNDDLRSKIWFVRKMFVTLAMLTVSASAWLYEDLAELQHATMKELLEKTDRILRAMSSDDNQNHSRGDFNASIGFHNNATIYNTRGDTDEYDIDDGHDESNNDDKDSCDNVDIAGGVDLREADAWDYQLVRHGNCLVMSAIPR
eukprot:m.267427 g.267427  ORF g.267427 m.267427 type:complete len:476 (-) comp73029_c0_seq1:67-1494(-)